MAFDLGSILGDVASIIGIGSGAKNLFGGGQQGGSSSSKTYVPTGLGSADQLFQQLLQLGGGGATGAAQAINPAIAQAFQKYLGIDTSGLVNAGNQAGALAQNQINPALFAQGNLTQNALNAQGAGNQLYQTAFDPQQALYNRYLQQVQDTSNAGSSMRGIGMGGEAVGLENQATNNFLQDWQNQQVGRENVGLQGLTAAYNQAGKDYAGGLAAGALTPGYAQQAGQLPYQGQTAAASQPFTAANLYSGAQAGANTNLGQFLNAINNYLNVGQGATEQAFGQQQQGLGNIQQGAGNLAANSGIWQSLGQIFGQGQGYGTADPTYAGPNLPY